MRLYLAIFLSLCLVLISHQESMHFEMMDLIVDKPLKEQFKLWHYATKKPYDLNSELGLIKYRVFKQNYKTINKINSKNLGYTLGLTDFVDLTEDEFMKGYTMSNPVKDEKTKGVVLVEKNREKDVITEFEFDEYTDIKVGKLQQVSPDWSSIYGYVKNQHGCGACWAFATISYIEAFARMIGFSYYLSEQQVLDCADANFGCGGGSLPAGIKYIYSVGSTSLNEYPYIARKSQCYDQQVYKRIGIQSYRFCSGNCTDNEILKFLSNGPYGTYIQVLAQFAFYRQGVWMPDACYDQYLNHGVTVVQYYYDRVKIRNSWGSNWGENGNAYILVNHPGDTRACGALDYAYQSHKVNMLG